VDIGFLQVDARRKRATCFVAGHDYGSDIAVRLGLLEPQTQAFVEFFVPGVTHFGTAERQEGDVVSLFV
jgi:hypothetical protein